MSDEYLPCAKRKDIVVIDRLATRFPAKQCGHHGCANLTKVVSPADCAGCILRIAVIEIVPVVAHQRPTVRDFGEPKLMPSGELVYPRTGYEPPKVPEGYKRKNDDIKHPDAWVFVPQWPPCGDRVMNNSVAPCGCVKINAFCASKHAAKRMQRINVETCVACPFRSNLEAEKVPVDLSLGDGVVQGVVGVVEGDAKLPAKGE